MRRSSHTQREPQDNGDNGMEALHNRFGQPYYDKYYALLLKEFPELYDIVKSKQID